MHQVPIEGRTGNSDDSIRAARRGSRSRMSFAGAVREFAIDELREPGRVASSFAAENKRCRANWGLPSSLSVTRPAIQMPRCRSMSSAIGSPPDLSGTLSGAENTAGRRERRRWPLPVLSASRQVENALASSVLVDRVRNPEISVPANCVARDPDAGQRFPIAHRGRTPSIIRVGGAVNVNVGPTTRRVSSSSFRASPVAPWAGFFGDDRQLRIGDSRAEKHQAHTRSLPTSSSRKRPSGPVVTAIGRMSGGSIMVRTCPGIQAPTDR